MSSTSVVGQNARALNHSSGRDWAALLGLNRYWPWLLAAVVIVSRLIMTGSVYFADGPAEIRAIRSARFVIQPPGYWLFIRTASLFPNPAIGIALMNWVFSGAAVIAFYCVARLLVDDWLARLGSVAYAVVFYAWFSGAVHSTYASQLLFPVLVFLLLVLHMRRQRMGYLAVASVAFGLGAGFRPSDGAFVGFMFVYYLLARAPKKQAVISFAIATLVCLGWLVPTVVCYGSLERVAWAGHYVGHITTVVSILASGVNSQSIANMARFAVPLAAAFGPLLALTLRTFRSAGDPIVSLLWWWIVPGAAFLLLCYMSDAPYLDFLTAPVLLLIVMELQKLKPRRAKALLGLCIAWNIAFFMFFRPVRITSLPWAMADTYAGKYTRYGVVHHWQPNLSELNLSSKEYL